MVGEQVTLSRPMTYFFAMSVSAGEGRGEGVTMKKIEEDYLIRSQKLRRKSSVAEKAMWSLLRNRRLNRYKFRRQHVIYPYIVDFICLHKKLIIELDGEHHKYQMHYDSQRTLYLNKKGYKVLRFWNQTLFNRDEEIITAILTALETNPSQALTPALSRTH